MISLAITAPALGPSSKTLDPMLPAMQFNSVLCSKEKLNTLTVCEKNKAPKPHKRPQ